MDDVDDLTGLIEYRRVHRPPKALLESTSRGGGPLDVVLLCGHRSGHPIPQHSLEGGSQIVNAVGGGVVGIVREDLEQRSAQNLLTLSHRGAQVAVAHRDDREVRRQDEIEVRCGFDELTKIGCHGNLAARCLASARLRMVDRADRRFAGHRPQVGGSPDHPSLAHTRSIGREEPNIEADLRNCFTLSVPGPSLATSQPKTTDLQRRDRACNAGRPRFR